jgi:hypothetical protein
LKLPNKSTYSFEYVKFKATFGPVKNVLSKFILFSFVVVSSLGAFESDARSNLDSINVDGKVLIITSEDLIGYQLQPKTNRTNQRDAQDEGSFTFKFPNIFNVFRSLF